MVISKHLEALADALRTVQQDGLRMSTTDIAQVERAVRNLISPAKDLERVAAEPTAPPLPQGICLNVAEVVGRAHLYLRGGRRIEPDDVTALSAMVVAHQGCVGRQVARG